MIVAKLNIDKIPRGCAECHFHGYDDLAWCERCNITREDIDECVDDPYYKADTCPLLEIDR